MFAGLGVRAALWLGESVWTSWLMKIPRWAWIALGVVLLIVAGLWWHGHKVHSFKRDAQRAQMAADNDHWRQKLAKEHAAAILWKQKFDRTMVQMSQAIKEKNDAKVRSINAGTADLLMHGPGKASCGQGNYPGPAASASRPKPLGRSGTDPVAPLPDGGGTALIALPFNDTVRSIGQCDINASRLSAWDAWYLGLEKMWPKTQ